MAKGRASLRELMGSPGAKAQNGRTLSLDDLPELLGDGMPDLPKNNVGRFRLIRALKQRFGDNFRSLPGLTNIVKEFDADIEFEQKVGRMQNLTKSRRA